MVTKYTKHAKEMLILRKISKKDVEACLSIPDMTVPGREGKIICLKAFGHKFLKCIIARDEQKIKLVTVYWVEKKRIKM